MGNVLEFLVDGTSGLAPGGVDGAAIVVGVCSEGVVGRGYLLGPSSDLEGLLGVGPLVDHLRDVFAAAGQDALVIAVPVAGIDAGYFTPVVHAGTGPDASASGSPAANADAVVEIVTGGELGTATYKVSEDGGATWGTTETTPVNGQIAIGSTGVTVTLEEGTHVAGDTYSTTIRTAIGPVTHTGSGPDISLAGDVLAAAQVQLVIVSGGGRNEGTYKLSLDGGDSFGAVRTIPADGEIAVGSTGVTITVPESPDMVSGDVYAFDLSAPIPTVSAVMSALETPLELYDVEFIYVVGATDAVDWAAMGTKADELFAAHRPTFFLCESRLPYANEDINDWVAYLAAERQSYSHRFVAVCAAFGEISDSTGRRLLRNAAGLVAGRLLAVPVMRAIGRVRDGGVSQLTLPVEYTSAMQEMLETVGYITAKHYAGLSSVYWGDAKTLADPTSDYQYLEVLRTVFKAVRKARIAALKSMYDEAGDVILGADAAGLAYLKSNIESALNTMKAAIPPELADFVVTIPAGQDIVNNGVGVEMDLIGIPIIRSIKLYAKYIYSGSAFDPRLS